ncbi:hypothetical protein T4D_9519 [Trichinella pseudospiralis]|uniref:Uncharacterized protein n=1 Tax=Trichinella pseudospiralis TaxID=6337 RepID=A0A0V1FV54_TRIPS|nr:hypothetical protein T4D_9519 [Trichinella pseudospiralis]
MYYIYLFVCLALKYHSSVYYIDYLKYHEKEITAGQILMHVKLIRQSALRSSLYSCLMSSSPSIHGFNFRLFSSTLLDK